MQYWASNKPKEKRTVVGPNVFLALAMYRERKTGVLKKNPELARYFRDDFRGGCCNG